LRTLRDTWVALFHVPVFTYLTRSVLLGRSANMSAPIPYAIGTFEGKAVGEDEQIFRSGLLDTTLRVSVNLKGGPAMQVSEFGQWIERA
jgi:hypothetical protein